MCRWSCYSPILTRRANLLNTLENGCWIILQGSKKGLLLFMEHQHWATKKAFLIRIYRRILTRTHILKPLFMSLMSPDADVFLLLIYLVATYTLQGNVKLLNGRRKFYRTIDVKERCVVIDYFMGLLGWYVWELTNTLKPKSKIATKRFPFTDTLMITFKQKTLLASYSFSLDPVLPTQGPWLVYRWSSHVYIRYGLAKRIPDICFKGAMYGIEPFRRNGKIWSTRERQHRQYLKISCWRWRCCIADRWTKLRQMTRQVSRVITVVGIF